jgi:hypothetical protein
VDRREDLDVALVREREREHVSGVLSVNVRALRRMQVRAWVAGVACCEEVGQQAEELIRKADVGRV